MHSVNPQTRTNTDSQDLHKIVDKPAFRPDIEGLRAIAILLVIAYHAHVPGFKGGYIGVDMFFVLSGYLITWLLIHEAEETGTINLVRFYARRARRLLPALLLVLAVTIGISAVLYAPFEQQALAHTALATAAYLSNAYFAQTAVDYLGTALETNPLLHTWSLSVEEQFYLVWPLLVAFAAGVSSRRTRQQSPQKVSLNRKNILLWMGALTLGSFILSVYLTDVRQPLAFFLSPARAWEFSIGALAILIPTGRFPFQQQLAKQSPTSKDPRAFGTLSEIVGWLGLGGILTAVLWFDETTLFPGTAAVLPAIATVLVLRACAARPASRLSKILSIRSFQEIGRLSYSWYLWHWPVLVFAGVILGDTPRLLVRVGLMVLALAIAQASYQWVENPVRHNRFLAGQSKRSILLGIVITTLSISLSLGWIQSAKAWSGHSDQIQYQNIRDQLPEIFHNGCTQIDLEKEAGSLEDNCAVGNPESSVTTVLLGDSHAAHWFGSLEAIALNNNWQLIPITKFGCSYVDRPRDINAKGYAHCDAWRQQALQKIADIEPDIVFVSGFGRHPFTAEQWIEGTQRTLQALSKTSQQVIILRDVPYPGFDVPSCQARQAWQPRWISQWMGQGASESSCDILRSQAPSGTRRSDYAARKVWKTKQAAYAAEATLAKQYKTVGIIDVIDNMCEGDTCAIKNDKLVPYMDDHHLALDFTSTLTASIQTQLDALLKNRIMP
ncbi:MAG: acyltransferase family protein [Cyanobacteria bacterium J06634_5]